MRATMTASSAPAMARNTTPRAAFARGPHRSTSPCRRTSSFPTAKFRSVETDPDEGPYHDCHDIRYFPGTHHEWTFRLSTEPSRPEVVRTATSDHRPGPLVLRYLSDTAEPQLLVYFRRHPVADAGRADRDRRHPGDALHANCRPCFSLGRIDRAGRELRLAALLLACFWCVVVFFCGLFFLAVWVF